MSEGAGEWPPRGWTPLARWRQRRFDRLMRRAAADGTLTWMMAEKCLDDADFCEEQRAEFEVLAGLEQDSWTRGGLLAEAAEWRDAAIEKRRMAAEFFDQADQRLADVQSKGDSDA